MHGRGEGRPWLARVQIASPEQREYHFSSSVSPSCSVSAELIQLTSVLYYRNVFTSLVTMETAGFSYYNTAALCSAQHCNCHKQTTKASGMPAQPPVWRPWIVTERDILRRNAIRERRSKPYARPSSTNNGSDTRGPEPGLPSFQHPVKLHWSKPVYDYMYQYGRQLLDAFPVQATICIVDQDPAESDDSDFESDYEDDSDTGDKPLKKNAPTLN
ncbi:protein ripply isoform X2 [Branchiostoma floridae x Branchiostoma belcheri]